MKPTELEPDLQRFLVEAHPRLVSGLALHCGDVLLAEELAQEVLIRTADRWDRVSRMESPLGWAFRAGTNLAASTFRRRAAERRALARLETVSSVPDPGGADHIAVRESLARLGAHQRQTVVLRYYLDLPVEKVARILDTTPSAVTTTCHRALRAMKADLGESVEEEVRNG